LRAAALAALREGVAPCDLYRACGVSWSQVVAWEARGRVAEAADVRVFSVVEEQPAERPLALWAEDELELRLGPWSVSVRHTDRGPGGRE
jgi:hypothetical protein